MLFSDKITQVKRNIFKEQRGAEFDTSSKQLINRARRLISKEAWWRPMRIVKEPAFSTVADLTTGTATFTLDSKTVTFAGVSLITQGVEPGQRIKNTTSGASGTVFIIASVDSQSQVTLNKVYDAATGATQTYNIMGKERFSLPIELDHIAFLWHEKFSYPYILTQIEEREFFFNAYDLDTSDTPDAYYLADPFGVERQPSGASVISIVSSSNVSGDQSSAGVSVVIFGVVGGVPDQEVLTLNGTTRVDGSKSFTHITRVVKTKTTTGRVTISDALPSAGSGSTLATLPAGQAYDEPMYERIGLNPIPNAVVPINMWGYRKPMRLVNDNDISEWGNDFDELEINLASYLGNIVERQKEDADRYLVAYNYALTRLKARNTDRLDYIFKLKRFNNSNFGSRRDSLLHPRLGYRQLGSRYGAQSW